jgi:hypothetical protein
LNKSANQLKVAAISSRQLVIASRLVASHKLVGATNIGVGTDQETKNKGIAAQWRLAVTLPEGS